ncbi:hypothetical protein M433DRAFT_6324 [Acidomyces richmondensis BFW]|nr:MAG: hypothetical protein FE78DRAFT_34450 [Acidomyces sp. 'richmondensis']KYG43429.1 hypothetical protein M433DRAFT_6324 [Acidomyces richmondensis BFW]
MCFNGTRWMGPEPERVRGRGKAMGAGGFSRDTANALPNPPRQRGARKAEMPCQPRWMGWPVGMAGADTVQLVPELCPTSEWAPRLRGSAALLRDDDVPVSPPPGQVHHASQIASVVGAVLADFVDGRPLPKPNTSAALNPCPRRRPLSPSSRSVIHLAGGAKP